MFGMDIAECPNCGKRFYGYTEEEVMEKYLMHMRLEAEIEDIIQEAVNE